MKSILPEVVSARFFASPPIIWVWFFIQLGVAGLHAASVAEFAREHEPYTRVSMVYGLVSGALLVAMKLVGIVTWQERRGRRLERAVAQMRAEREGTSEWGGAQYTEGRKLASFVGNDSFARPNPGPEGAIQTVIVRDKFGRELAKALDKWAGPPALDWHPLCSSYIQHRGADRKRPTPAWPVPLPATRVSPRAGLTDQPEARREHHRTPDARGRTSPHAGPAGPVRSSTASSSGGAPRTARRRRPPPTPSRPARSATATNSASATMPCGCASPPCPRAWAKNRARLPGPPAAQTTRGRGAGSLVRRGGENYCSAGPGICIAAPPRRPRRPCRGASLTRSPNANLRGGY
jgi:hypothetical protein